MDAKTPRVNAGSMRERELEVEIARLKAELEVLGGGAEPTEIAARFLAMAANTVDQAIAAAREEADDIVSGVAAEAEARRAEAERMKAEAADHLHVERARVADEVERLAEVRSALENERTVLERYHEELKRRVQQLAESMVSFMTTEPPLAAIDELAALALDPDTAAVDPGLARRNRPPEDASVGEAVAEPLADQEELVVPIRRRSGLFARSWGREGDAAPRAPHAPTGDDGVFGASASQLIEQISPERLAAALAEDLDEDARFRSFLDGDGERDPSRDWLLRTEGE